MGKCLGVNNRSYVVAAVAILRDREPEPPMTWIERFKPGYGVWITAVPDRAERSAFAHGRERPRVYASDWERE